MYDVIIVGGGAAGLSGALNFVRARKKVLVIDSNQPRNQVAKESHGYLTQDRVTPAKIKERAQENLFAYDHQVLVFGEVFKIVKEDKQFIIELATGEIFCSRTVLVATGVQETLPTVKNLRGFYGKTVHYCPWCEGYEARDSRVLVLNETDTVLHIVKLISNWTNTIFVATNGHQLPEQIKILLEKKKISYNESEIQEIIGEDQQVEKVRFEDGTIVLCDHIFTNIYIDTLFYFLRFLNLERNDDGKIVTDCNGESSVKGLYLAGETRYHSTGQITDAVADGSTISKNIIKQMIEDQF